MHCLQTHQLSLNLGINRKKTSVLWQYFKKFAIRLDTTWGAGRVDGFAVTVKSAGLDDEEKIVSLANLELSPETFTVTGLLPGRNYVFEVKSMLGNIRALEAYTFSFSTCECEFHEYLTEYRLQTELSKKITRNLSEIMS